MSSGRCHRSGCDFHGQSNQGGFCSKHWREQQVEWGFPADSWSRAPPPAAEGKASILKGELKIGACSIQVRLGDLTTENVDAIVNAANRDLVHGSGLAGAIVKKGGEIIQDESHIYIMEKGRLEEGQVMHTGAGKLPCKNIIHTVGPVYYDGKRGEAVVLSMAMRNTLVRANELKCRSISVPAISSGIFNFPKDQCATILFDTTIQYFKEMEGKESTIREVRFTNFDEPTVSFFVRENERRSKLAAAPVTAAVETPAPTTPATDAATAPELPVASPVVTPNP